MYDILDDTQGTAAGAHPDYRGQSVQLMNTELSLDAAYIQYVQQDGLGFRGLVQRKKTLQNMMLRLKSSTNCRPWPA